MTEFENDEQSLESTETVDNQDTNYPENPESFNESDQDEPASSDEGRDQEELEPPPQEQDEHSKPLYTSEELTYLVESDMDIDTTRLSPEGQATLKQFQRLYTKKLQAVAEEKRKLTETSNENIRQPSNPFEQTYARYKNNPRQIKAEINAKIDELEEKDPYSEENRRLIRGLRNLKEDLSDRYNDDMERSQKISRIVNETTMEINKAIPDFKEKASAITEFGQELGFSLEELEYLSNPANTGRLAAKFTIGIAKAYNKLNSGKSAEKKIKKQQPPQLQSSGTGGQQFKKDPNKMSQKEFESWWRKKHGE